MTPKISVCESTWTMTSWAHKMDKLAVCGGSFWFNNCSSCELRWEIEVEVNLRTASLQFRWAKEQRSQWFIPKREITDTAMRVVSIEKSTVVLLCVTAVSGVGV